MIEKLTINHSIMKVITDWALHSEAVGPKNHRHIEGCNFDELGAKTTDAVMGQLADTMRDNQRLLTLMNGLLSHEFAESCQECGIGQSAIWAEAKEYIASRKDSPPKTSSQE